MRSGPRVVLAFAAVHLALGLIAARADGFTVEEGFGGAAYRGDFANTGSAPRFTISGTYMHRDWGVSVMGIGLVPDFGYIDCYGSECAYAAKPVDGFGMVGVDAKHTFTLIGDLRRWRGRIDMFLHAGPRYVWGSDNIDKYSGPGVGGGAGIDFDMYVVGAYVDFGVDTMVLHRPSSPTLAGSLPYVSIGFRFGWM